MQTTGPVNARLGCASLWRQDSQHSSPLTLLTVRSALDRGDRKRQGDQVGRVQRGVNPRGQCNECSQCVCTAT